MKSKQSLPTINDQFIEKSMEDRFLAMANCSPVLLWMSGKDSLCTFFNQTWLDFTGKTLAEECGVGWTKSLHPEDYSHVLDCYHKAFDERRPFEIEYRLKRFDGEYRWILDKGAPFFDKNDCFQGYIGSCIDLTSQKQAELNRKQEIQRLLVLNNKLLRVNAELEEFSNIVAHDLKSPLRHLFMYTELLKSDLDPEVLSKDAQYALEMIENVATKAKALIDDLLVLATLGATSLKFEKTCLNTLVNQVTKNFALELSQIEGRVVVEPLPEVTCCPNLMEQVFQNLIQNAIKFRHKVRQLQITIGVRDDGDMWRLYVKDNGIGIDSRFLHAVFDAFKQLAPQDGEEGTGIGLPIVKKIIGIHLGDVWALSEGSQKGSTFYFTLPKEMQKVELRE